MESTQSVHGRITYRRVEAVIDAKIENLNYVKNQFMHDRASIDAMQFAIQTLQAVREELRQRDGTHYWPMPL